MCIKKALIGCTERPYVSLGPRVKTQGKITHICTGALQSRRAARAVVCKIQSETTSFSGKTAFSVGLQTGQMQSFLCPKQASACCRRPEINARCCGSWCRYTCSPRPRTGEAVRVHLCSPLSVHLLSPWSMDTCWHSVKTH